MTEEQRWRSSDGEAAVEEQRSEVAETLRRAPGSQEPPIHSGGWHDTPTVLLPEVELKPKAV